MIQAHYTSKKALKESIGKPLKYNETSIFGEEFNPNSHFVVADYSPSRKWFATVYMKNGLINKVT